MRELHAVEEARIVFLNITLKYVDDMTMTVPTRYCNSQTISTTALKLVVLLVL